MTDQDWKERYTDCLIWCETLKKELSVARTSLEAALDTLKPLATKSLREEDYAIAEAVYYDFRPKETE